NYDLEAKFEKQEKEFEKQQAEIAAMEDFVQRNIARASTTKRAQSTRKRLEKLDKVDAPLGYEAEAKISFAIEKSSGNDVIHVDNLSYTHPGNNDPLFEDVSFHIYKGERVALIGDNGVGKTTLLRAILEKQTDITLGTNVTIGYYDQEQGNLNDENTVLEELWQD